MCSTCRQAVNVAEIESGPASGAKPRWMRARLGKNQPLSKSFCSVLLVAAIALQLGARSSIQAATVCTGAVNPGVLVAQSSLPQPAVTLQEHGLLQACRRCMRARYSPGAGPVQARRRPDTGRVQTGYRPCAGRVAGMHLAPKNAKRLLHRRCCHVAVDVAVSGQRCLGAGAASGIGSACRLWRRQQQHGCEAY